MEIQRDFDVAAPPGEVFELLVDLERVGSCIPGGEVGAAAEGVHPASIAVRLGPMRFDYQGTVSILEQAAEARRAVLVAELRERRGQGKASAQMTMDVSEDSAAGSRVESVTELRLTGRAAQMGRGVIDDVAERMVADMATCIGARLAPPREGEGEGDVAEAAAPASAPPVRGIRLGLAVLWTRIKRRFRAIWDALGRVGKKPTGGEDG